MKIAVISASNEKLAYQYETTNKIKEAYCKKYGYDFFFDKIEDSTDDSYFYRQKMLLKYLDSYDWVMWMDVDAWFNDFNRVLEDLIDEYERKDTRIMVSREDQSMDSPKKWIGSYVNSGVLICKGKKEETKTLIKDWMNPSEDIKRLRDASTNLNDQPILSIKMVADSFFIKHTTYVPQEEMNSFLRKDGIATPVFYDDEVLNRFILHSAGMKMGAITKDVFAIVVNNTIEKNKLDIPMIEISDIDDIKKKIEKYRNSMSRRH